MKTENTIFKAMELFEIICYRNRLNSREVGLFYALLHLWNRAGRPATFGGWFNQVSPLSGLGTDKTVQSARDKLIKKGVIFYYKKGFSGEPLYSFNAIFSLENPLLVKTTGKVTSENTSKRQVSGELTASKRQVSGDSPQGKDKEEEEEEEKGASKVSKFNALEISLPFESEQFKKAYSDWIRFRREKKISVREPYILRRIEKFKEWGEQTSILAMRDSIDNDYHGLFPDKFNEKQGSTPHQIENKKQLGKMGDPQNLTLENI